jgi:hypothetical protein
MEISLITKILPLKTFLLTGKVNNSDLINNLKISVKNKINNSNLHYKTHVKGKFTGFEALTQDFYFNCFIKSILEEIRVVYPNDFGIKDSWGNIYNKSDSAALHNHNGTTAFCGILYLTEGGPGTYFPEYDITIQEEIGRYLIFHPLLLHKVNKITNDLERITIAFNAEECKIWEKK